MTGGIMIAAAAYLWKRWRKKEAVKTAVTLSALVALYPILAGGSMEKIWLGYLTTLLLSAPIPALMFVNYAHQMPAGQRHEPYYIPKGEQVCLLLQPHGIFKGEQVCLLLQPHGIFKGEQMCPLLQPHGISKGEQMCPLLQPHGISKGEPVCLLLQPLCCGWFFSGVAGDGTVVLGPDGGVSTGTSRCPDRPDRDGVTAAGITVP